jgi:hypothetical protein
MKFIIWTWDYSKFVGGVRIQHKLCHLLNMLGAEAYVTCEITNPEWNTPIYDGNGFDKENTIVIYPECIQDNLLDAKYVVRWLLYHQVADYDENDYVFKLFEHFHSKNNKCDGILRVLDYDLSPWKNLNQQRTHNMIVVRKGAWKLNHIKINLPNLIIYDDIEKENSEDVIAEYMNICEQVICLDDTCLIAAQAALCGCISIVVPDPKYNAKQWKELLPAMKFGIAYGNSPLEIEHAKFTKNLVRYNVQKISDQSIHHVSDFIEYWKNIIK